MSCVCLRQGSRKKKKKGRHQLHPATSLSPSQDTEGTEINLAAAPKIEHEPPLEQDVGCVRTSRGHRGQQSYFCSTTGPPGMDAHSFIGLPASRGRAHTQRNKKCVHTYKLCQWTIGGSGTFSIWLQLTVMSSESPMFSVTWGYLCFVFFLCVFMWEQFAGFWRWRAMETHLAPSDLMSQTHVSLSVCVCLPFLGLQYNTMDIGSHLQGYFSCFWRI